jgi:hypothetical protein
MHSWSRTAVLAIFLGVACAAPDEGPTGDLSMTTVLRSAISGGQTIPVALAWVHVHGTTARGQPFDAWYRATGTTGQFVIRIAKIPVGSYLAHGKAFQSSTASRDDPADFESVGDVGFVVAANATTSVSLTLQQNTDRWPPDRVENHAPVVDGLVASTAAIDSSASATPITLQASASDPDGPGDVVSYQWTATCSPALAPGQDPGAFSAPGALQTTWTPPTGYEGTVTFEFSVADRRFARSSVSMALAVSPRFGSGSVAFIIDVNSSPEVLSLTIADGQLAPGELTQVTVLAVDPDGDDLRYAWDDGACDGTFGSPTAATTTYTAGAIASACALTVTVTDRAAAPPHDARGATTTSTLVVTVAQAPVWYAPELVLVGWSGTAGVPIAPGTSVTFFVEAIQMQGTPPVATPVADLRWSEPGGGTFTPTTAGDLGTVSWTTPPCAGLTAPYVVDVTATAVGSPSLPSLSTSLTFPVTVACP